MGDFDGDGQLDFGVWRPSNGIWYLRESGQPGSTVQQQWGLQGDIPVPADYDGDGKTDFAVWRPSDGSWYVILSSTGSVLTRQWGLPGDRALTGDFDGDGKADFVVWRPSNQTWYEQLSANASSVSVQWGLPGDIPVVGDYDGSGRQEIAVWRPSNGTWYVISGSTGQPFTQQWGLPGDIPVVADFDSDGKTDFALWRPLNQTLYVIPSGNPLAPYNQQAPQPAGIVATKYPIGPLNKGVFFQVAGDFDGDGIADFAAWNPRTGYWFVVPSSNPASPISKQWGIPGDIPVPGDYDRDGKTDYAVWRPSEGNWYVIQSSHPLAPVSQSWGVPGDIPVRGDYDGDGQTDYAVWRPSEGNWYVLPSTGPSSPIVTQWGLPGDVPVPADYDGDHKTDYAVWRPSSGTWYVIPSGSDVAYSQQWGLPGDLPLTGDFDGDGKADLVVARPVANSDFEQLTSQPSLPVVQSFGNGQSQLAYNFVPGGPATIASVSNQSPAPLTALYISTTGLNVNAPVTIRFSDSLGYSVTQQSIRVHPDGTVVAAVPIYADSNARTSSATVSLTLIQASSTTSPISITILDLPSVQSYGMQPGAISRAFLNYESMGIARRVNELQAFQQVRGNTVDTTSEIASLKQMQLAVIQARNDVDRVSADSSTTIPAATLSDGTNVEFDANSLDMMDRVIGAYLTQMAPYLASPPPNAPAIHVHKSLTVTPTATRSGLAGFGAMHPAQSGPSTRRRSALARRLAAAQINASAQSGLMQTLTGFLTTSANLSGIAATWQSWSSSGQPPPGGGEPDRNFLDDISAVTGGISGALGFYALKNPSQSMPVTAAAGALGAVSGIASILNDMGHELGALAFVISASSNTDPQVINDAWDEIVSKNNHLVVDTIQTELSLFSYGTSASDLPLFSSALDTFGLDFAAQMQTSAENGALNTTLQATGLFTNLTSYYLDNGFDSLSNLATSFENEAASGAISLGNAFGDLVSNVSITNGSGAYSALSGIDLSSDLSDQVSVLADPSGAYTITVPLGDPNFDYSNATLAAVDPETGNILGSVPINLSTLTSQNSPPIPTVTGSCVDDDSGSPDGDDPDCDN